MSWSPFLFKPLFPIAFCCLISALSSSAFGAQISKLYSASVPVASQQTSERGAGFDEAFIRVLVKASGQYERIVQDNAAASWLPAEPYVQTFSYRENPAYLLYLQKQQEKERLALENADQMEVLPDVSSDELVVDAFGDPQALVEEEALLVDAPPLPYLLDVSFAPSLVQEKMTSFGIPVWGSTRPSVLVWIVIESEGERSIVGTSDDRYLVKALLTKGEQRGVPLFLPVADLQDVGSINIDDLWGLYTDSVDLASERYLADVVVMMRMYQTGEQLWSGNWVIKQRQALESGALYDAEPDAVIESLVSDLAATLSSRYAVLKQTSELGNTLNVEISQINSFEDYIGLQRYLKSLPPVASMQLMWVGQGRAAYHLVLRGPNTQFFEHIELGGNLKPGGTVTPDGFSTAPLDSMEAETEAAGVKSWHWPDVKTEYFIWSVDR